MTSLGLGTLALTIEDVTYMHMPPYDDDGHTAVSTPDRPRPRLVFGRRVVHARGFLHGDP